MPVISNPLPPQDNLLALLRYEPETGTLYWRNRPRILFVTSRSWNSWNAKNADKVALNNIDPAGYRRGHIHAHSFAAHRIIWKMVTGTDPDKIDHINGCRSDNRFENLRSVHSQTNQKNMKRFANNTSGRTGVIKDTRRGGWRADIKIMYQSVYLGCFDTFEEACAAREAAERVVAFHPNHGRG